MSPIPISPDIIGGHEKWIIYGDPKMAKTSVALTAPPPIYFLSISMDNELKVYWSEHFQENYAERLPMDALQYDVAVSSQNGKDLIEAAVEADARGNGFQFNTIVVDNATRLTELQVEVALELSYDSSRESKRKTKTTKQKKEETGITAPDRREWGGAQNLMRSFTSDLYNIDKHIVLIAHEHQDTTSDMASGFPKIVKVKPLFIGKDRTLLANVFDNVWRMTKEAQFYVARTEAGKHPDGYNVVAGSRVGGVISKDWSNPDLSEAVKKFRDHASKMAKKQQKKEEKR